ncbi:MAG: hypothetical protein ABR607_13655 [Pyrinomonadaceae bacterium]
MERSVTPRIPNHDDPERAKARDITTYDEIAVGRGARSISYPMIVGLRFTSPQASRGPPRFVGRTDHSGR